MIIFVPLSLSGPPFLDTSTNSREEASLLSLSLSLSLSEIIRFFFLFLFLFERWKDSRTDNSSGRIGGGRERGIKNGRNAEIPRHVLFSFPFLSFLFFFFLFPPITFFTPSSIEPVGRTTLAVSRFPLLLAGKNPVKNGAAGRGGGKRKGKKGGNEEAGAAASMSSRSKPGELHRRRKTYATVTKRER